MIAGYAFRFRPVLAVTVAIAFAFLLSLGNWQLNRLQWKLSLIEKVETRIGADPILFNEAVARAANGEDMEYTPVRLSGVFQSDYETRVYGSNGRGPGVFVFVPLKTPNGNMIFVNQGFVPQQISDWECICDPATPVGVTGLLRSREEPRPPASWFLPKGAPTDGLWLIRDPLKFAEAASIETVSYYVDSFAIEGVDWPKGGETRLEFNNRHFEYALTWFGAAAALLAVFVAFSLHRRE